MTKSHPDDTPLHLSTLSLHADDDHSTGISDIAPALHLSTTFRYPSDPNLLYTAHQLQQRQQTDQQPGPSRHVYSRISAPNLLRLESILTPLLHAPSLAYTSGLAATHALYTVIRPTHVFITGGYHGVHGVLRVLSRLTNDTAFIIQPMSSAEELCGPGDVIHIETPLNPTGEVQPIATYAQLAHSRGGFIVVDATFGPPPIQDPFQHGADTVLHSGTKFLGGHSDMLLGVIAIATQHDRWLKQLIQDRVFLGAVPGNLEGWLGIRSLRTLSLRVERQARTAEQLVNWLSLILSNKNSHCTQIPIPSIPTTTSTSTSQSTSRMNSRMSTSTQELTSVNQVISSVLHSSLQLKFNPVQNEWITTQMSSNLHSPVFAIICTSERYAKVWPSQLKLWSHGTSLGGVESLIEWRAMSDTTVDTRLLRLSPGVEEPIDLFRDLVRGCRTMMTLNGDEGGGRDGIPSNGARQVNGNDDDVGGLGQNGDELGFIPVDDDE